MKTPCAPSIATGIESVSSRSPWIRFAPSARSAIAAGDGPRACAARRSPSWPGVSLTWYTWLEQARKIAASPKVVDALARALRLSPAEHRHLRALSGLPDLSEHEDTDDSRLQRLVDALMPNLAVVHDGRLDFVVWNAAFARIRVDPAELPADRRNLLWWMFTDERTRAMMPRWEPAARAILGQFRALVGRTPDDPHLNALVAALAEASPQFRTWWQDYPVQDFRASTIYPRPPCRRPREPGRLPAAPGREPRPADGRPPPRHRRRPRPHRNPA
ncbi:helix-turn-helix domain-containing protein [Nocardia tengchongensis]|uniref:Helix-turn-helix domain-containing protein n=1 Tax=Nocardia tengchongensis TaxID=2055889 RepID=A0ABX8CLQ2_9NOCA|nr:helix-turn-helix domain-containing protein [Nocardia tengchongensis]